MDPTTAANPCSMTTYLKTPIAEAKHTITPRYGVTADGYTVRSGAPTCVMIRLEGEKRWRRLMVWQFSNAGTFFVRVGGVPLIVPVNDIPPEHEGYPVSAGTTWTSD